MGIDKDLVIDSFDSWADFVGNFDHFGGILNPNYVGYYSDSFYWDYSFAL